MGTAFGGGFGVGARGPTKGAVPIVLVVLVVLVVLLVLVVSVLLLVLLLVLCIIFTLVPSPFCLAPFRDCRASNGLTPGPGAAEFSVVPLRLAARVSTFAWRLQCLRCTRVHIRVVARAYCTTATHRRARDSVNCRTCPDVCVRCKYEYGTRVKCRMFLLDRGPYRAIQTIPIL